METWEEFVVSQPREAEFIFCHQTFAGAKASSDFTLDGIPNTYFDELAPNAQVISGDIHVPQRCGSVLYVGCPYPISFGDSFAPRVLWWDGEKLKSIPRKTIRKLVIDLQAEEVLADEQHLKPGDQIKVRLHLPRTEFKDWQTHKKGIEEEAEHLGVELFAVELREQKTRKRIRLEDPDALFKNVVPIDASPKDLLTKFCQTRGIAEPIETAGLELIE